jgi:hypothetical protein
VCFFSCFLSLKTASTRLQPIVMAFGENFRIADVGVQLRAAANPADIEAAEAETAELRDSEEPDLAPAESVVETFATDVEAPGMLAAAASVFAKVFKVGARARSAPRASNSASVDESVASQQESRDEILPDEGVEETASSAEEKQAWETTKETRGSFGPTRAESKGKGLPVDGDGDGYTQDSRPPADRSSYYSDDQTEWPPDTAKAHIVNDECVVDLGNPPQWTET